MKVLKNISAEVPGVGTAVTRDLLIVSIENYQESVRGIANIRKAIAMIEKLEKMDGEIKLEDAEFDYIYKAVDENKWSPNALKFKEFFEQIARVKDE